MEQIDLLEKIFKPYGQVPWDDLIDPFWTDLLSHVDEAWLALDSGFSRSPAYLVPRSLHLRRMALKLPLVNRNYLRRHCLRHLPLLAFSAPGR